MIEFILLFDCHPPLFYLINSLPLQTGFVSKFALRFLPAFFGALTPVIIWLGFKNSRFPQAKSISALGALIIALSPHAVSLSRIARMYSFLMPAAALFVWICYRHYQDQNNPSRLFILLDFLTSIFLLFHHYMTGFLIFFSCFIVKSKKIIGLRILAIFLLTCWLGFSLKFGSFSGRLTSWLDSSSFSDVVLAPGIIIFSPYMVQAFAVVKLALFIILLPPIIWYLPRAYRKLAFLLQFLIWTSILGQFLVSKFFEQILGSSTYQIKHLIYLGPLISLYLALIIGTIKFKLLRNFLGIILVGSLAMMSIQEHYHERRDNYIRAYQLTEEIESNLLNENSKQITAGLSTVFLPQGIDRELYGENKVKFFNIELAEVVNSNKPPEAIFVLWRNSGGNIGFDPAEQLNFERLINSGYEIKYLNHFGAESQVLLYTFVRTEELEDFIQEQSIDTWKAKANFPILRLFSSLLVDSTEIYLISRTENSAVHNEVEKIIERSGFVDSVEFVPTAGFEIQSLAFRYRIKKIPGKLGQLFYERYLEPAFFNEAPDYIYSQGYPMKLNIHWTFDPLIKLLLQIFSHLLAMAIIIPWPRISV